VGLDEVRRAWTALGAEDPLWAVRVHPGKRHGGWDEAQFLATGVDEVNRSLAWLDRLGLAPGQAGRKPPLGRVLDLGCGAGRLSQALARHADEVVGVDVSATMLDTAHRLNQQRNLRFVLNETADLKQFDDASYDLVFTALVLQHLPRPLIEGYLREFLRVLVPGGIVLAQITTRPRWTARALVWRFAPWPLVRVLQKRVLGYPAPMRMTRISPARVREVVQGAGGRVLATKPDLESSPDWYCTWYAIRRENQTIRAESDPERPS
jgi:SAM-dependent methyltransferase